MTKPRWRVVAWGSDEFPDLDYETEDPPRSFLNWDYPCVSVACLTPIPASSIRAALEKENGPSA